MSWKVELHGMIERFAQAHDLSSHDIIFFLASAICGTMAWRGYTDETARILFEKMFDEFRERKMEVNEDGDT